MKKVEFKYFLDGKEVDGSLINWEYSTSIVCRGNDIYVDYEKQDSEHIYNYFEEPKESIIPDIFASILLNGLLPIADSGENVEEKIMEACDTVSGDYSIDSSVGVKHNKYKAPLDIVQTRQFPKALQAVALATAFGNKKYEATDKDFLNFKRVTGGSQTYFDAAARHNTEREEIDEDSGLPHIIHAVWDMLAGLELFLEENEVDIKVLSQLYLQDLHK